MKTKILTTVNISKNILLLFCAIILVSCNQDEFEIIDGTENVPTAAVLKNLFKTELDRKTTIVPYNVSSDLTYTSLNGVQLSITSSCLRKNGNPVTGLVQLHYVEIFDKGNMLVTNKPTLGKIGSDLELIETGGEFYIQVKQDGVNLTLTCPYVLDIPTSLTGGTKPGMRPFKGTITTDEELEWNEQLTSFEIITNSHASTPIYQAIVPEMGWFNCDRYNAFTGPKTDITVNVPAGYGSSSAVFLSVKTFPNMLGNTYGKFPVGLDCFVIFVTEQDGKFRYAIKPQVLTANQQITFSLSETTTVTSSELTAVINALQ